MKYTIILMLKAKSTWWVMSKEYRQNMFKRDLFPLLSEYSNELQFQVFNSEAFHSSVSDFISIETQNLQAYYEFMQKLKATRLFAGEYFELQDLLMGAENGFKDFNTSLKQTKGLILN